MTRKIDDRKYIKYLLQSLNVNDLKQICRDFGIKGFSKFKKAELVDFILDSLSEEEYSEFINQKELDIIKGGIDLAIKKINGEDRESLTGIKIVNPDRHEIELSFKGFNWEINSFLSITPKNIEDPERDCDCRIGSNMGFCSHFWIAFILSLKEDFLKLSDWTLTALPDDFKEKIKPIKLSISSGKGEGGEAEDKISLVDESSDSSVLMKHSGKSITIYESTVTEVVERQSEFQDNITTYYHVSLKDIKLGPRVAKKSDFKEEDVVNIDKLKLRISEKLQNENNLKEGDKINLNGKLDKDNFWGMLVKNIRKVQKI
jgi:hypothetical protein